MSVVEQQQEYLQRHRGQSWYLLPHLTRGKLFWAALKHPRHASIYVRPYIVVAQGNFDYQDGSKGCMLAVAGLETNSGFGINVYPQSSRTWIRNVTLRVPRKDAKRIPPGREEKSRTKDYNGDDSAPLYIEEGSIWEPRTNTIVDLSTLLVIEGCSALLCRPVGKLSCSSLERLDSIMDRLRGLPMDQYVHVMSTPTARYSVRKSPGYVSSAKKAQFQGDTFETGVNPATISIFRPNDGIHAALGLDTILPREALRGQEFQYVCAVLDRRSRTMV